MRKVYQRNRFQQVPEDPAANFHRWGSLYRPMLTARVVDEVEAEMVKAGEAFFHVSGAGHEGAVALHPFLTDEDWLCLHYRDKALMLARGVPVEQFFHSLLCNATSHSAGRQMSAHLSDPSRRIVSIPAPMGNQALHAVGIASAIKDSPSPDSPSPCPLPRGEREQTQSGRGAQAAPTIPLPTAAARKDEGCRSRPIVVCSMGDGTTQQGEVMEAIAEAVRSQLPVLFWIEDNGYSISTTTKGKTFYSLPDGAPGGRALPTEFFGLPIHRLNGRDVVECEPQISQIVMNVRETRRPAIVVSEVERLASHTNADDHRVYREEGEIEAARTKGDPILNLREHLLRNGISEQELTKMTEEIRAKVRAAAEKARQAEDPQPCFEAKRALPPPARWRDGSDVVPMIAGAPNPRPGNDGEAEPRQSDRTTSEPSRERCEWKLTMLEAMREVLRHHLANDFRVTLYGEDIEDPKGDVFGLTRGLSKAFPGRVANSALSESTIIGVSIGRALAGQRPVAFIQFADFLPLAFNQIACELSSMYWRTNGGWQCPVIVMVACGGYRPGLGPFHAQTHEAIFAHLPGVDVLMPSNAGDAAGLLNAAFESGRPTLFFYPKSLLNNRERATELDVTKHIVPIGQALQCGRPSPTGDRPSVTIVTWGGCVPLCERVTREINKVGFEVDLLDLRCLSPWDAGAVCESARRSRKLLIVHEDNLTCGFGAEVAATIAEKVSRVAVRRIARADTFIPCHFANQLEVLPSFRRILGVAAEMLDLELTWEQPPPQHNDGLITIEALGSSPSDESVTIVVWKIKPGDRVEAGQHIADAESDKTIFEMNASRAGIVESILVPPGQTVAIGTPLVKLRSRESDGVYRPTSREALGQPKLARRS